MTKSLEYVPEAGQLDTPLSEIRTKTFVRSELTQTLNSPNEIARKVGYQSAQELIVATRIINLATELGFSSVREMLNFVETANTLKASGDAEIPENENQGLSDSFTRAQKLELVGC